MGKRSTLRKPVVYYGKRAGTKRSDRHWIDPEGNIWDSRYEYLVFRAYADAGKEVRRTSKSDTFSFMLQISGGKCRACGATEVGQQRTYTPDLHVTADYPESPTVEYYIEAKGYLRAKERALLRAFYKENPDAPVRYLLQRDFPATARSKVTGQRGSIVQWFHKFLPKAKIAIWSGHAIDEKDWRSGESLAPAKAVKASRKPRRKLQGAHADRGVGDGSAADSGTDASAVLSTTGKAARRTRSRKVENT